MIVTLYSGAVLSGDPAYILYNNIIVFFSLLWKRWNAQQ